MRHSLRSRAAVTVAEARYAENLQGIYARHVDDPGRHDLLAFMKDLLQVFGEVRSNWARCSRNDTPVWSMH